MTKASRQGRRLRLEVDDGIEFLIDPVSAVRGRLLTNMFLLAAVGELTAAQAEVIFIECLGPANYARATGFLIDQFEDDLEDLEHLGEYRCTWGPDGVLEPAEDLVAERLPSELAGLRFVARDPSRERRFESLDLRQEEVEALALCAFYWQTVAGMEAVDAFIAEGEGLGGSLKAMALLQSRMAPSLSRTSRRTESANPTKQGDTPDTTTPPSGGKPVALPPRPLEPQHAERPRKGAAFFRRH